MSRSRRLIGSRELIGADAAHLMISTSSRFTKPVEALSTTRFDLELQDSRRLMELLRATREPPASTLTLSDAGLLLEG